MKFYSSIKLIALARLISIVRRKMGEQLCKKIMTLSKEKSHHKLLNISIKKVGGNNLNPNIS